MVFQFPPKMVFVNFSTCIFAEGPFNQKPLALGEIREAIWRYFVMKLPSQNDEKCPTFSKTRSGETSREKFRMVRALLPDTLRPHQFQPKSGHLLVTWVFSNFRFSDVRFSRCFVLQNMFAKYVGEISRNK